MPTLRIKLGNRLVGTITNVVTDKNIFVFDPGYIEDEHRPVLSLSFYDIERKLITRPREVQRRLPPFFSNLLPERDGVLRDYLAQRAGISPEREFPLLWLVGADLPGAVIAEDSEGEPVPPPEEKSGTREATRQEVLRFSLAGVQLKFSAIDRGGKQLRIPAQGRDGQWIVKLPSPRFPKVPENEFAMMTLAREVDRVPIRAGAVRPIGVSGRIRGRQNKRVLYPAFRPRAGRRANSRRRLQSDLRTVSRKEVRAARIHGHGQGHLSASRRERVNGINSARCFQCGDR
jgi:HipA-like protein